MVAGKVIQWKNPSREVETCRSGWGASLMADKGGLLLMLYDRAIRCMEEAIELIDAGDMIAKGEQLVQAQDVVLQLADALEKDSEDEQVRSISFNLERLYLYIYRRLIRGNMHLDRDAIREARRLMGTLYQAWEHILLDAAPGSFEVAMSMPARA